MFQTFLFHFTKKKSQKSYLPVFDHISCFYLLTSHRAKTTKLKHNERWVSFELQFVFFSTYNLLEMSHNNK